MRYDDKKWGEMMDAAYEEMCAARRQVVGVEGDKRARSYDDAEAVSAWLKYGEIPGTATPV